VTWPERNNSAQQLQSGKLPRRADSALANARRDCQVSNLCRAFGLKNPRVPIKRVCGLKKQVQLIRALLDTTLGKAAEGRRSPRREAYPGDLRTARSVMECASPLALCWQMKCPRDFRVIFCAPMTI
jgi:hypothetical protein